MANAGFASAVIDFERKLQLLAVWFPDGATTTGCVADSS